MSTNKKEKKKRPDERNTRIIMPRKETWVFSYVRHFPPKSFLKKGLHNENITIVYIYERNKLLLLIYYFVLK